jgi:hypothetical protein
MKLDESACLILRGMEAHGKVEKLLAPPLTILGSTEAPSSQALPSLPCVLSFVPAMMARDEQLALRLKAPENSQHSPVEALEQFDYFLCKWQQVAASGCSSGCCEQVAANCCKWLL